MEIDTLNSLTYKADGATIKLSGDGFELLFYYGENKIIMTNLDGKEIATIYLHDADLKKLLEQI